MAKGLDPAVSKENGQKVMCEWAKRLSRAGLGVKAATKVHKELLEATKPVSCTIVRRSGKDKSAPDADETTTDFIEVPDWAARAKGLDMLYSIHGAYAEKKVKATVDGTLELKDARAKLASKLLPEFAAGGAEGTVGKPE